MIENLLKALVPTAVIALLLLIAAWRPWRAAAPRGAWGTALALGLGYIAADLALRFWPIDQLQRLWPAGTSRWVPHAVLVGTLIALAAALSRARGIALAAIILTPVAAAAVLYWRMSLTPPAGVQPAPTAIAAAIAGVLVGFAIHAASRAASDLRVPVTALAAWGTLPVALLQSKTLSMAQAAGAVAIVLTMLSALALLRPRAGVMAGAAPALGALAAALGVAWHVAPPEGARPPPAAAALMLAAALAPVLHALRPVARLGRWPATILAGAIALGLGLGAVALTASGFDFSGL